jgi:PST family polysaccharide transporter
MTQTTLTRLGTFLDGPSVGNATWLLGDKAARMVVNVVVWTIVARSLGPDRFGRLSYLLAAVAFFSPLATAGLETLLVREFVRRPERSREIASAGVAVRAAGAVLAVCLAVLAVLALDGHLAEWLAVLLLGSVFLFQVFDVFDTYLQARLEARWAVLPKLAAFALGSIARLWAAHQRAPLEVFAAIQCAEAAASALAFCGTNWVRRALPHVSRPSSDTMGALVRMGLPLAGASALVMVYLRVDQLMLEQMSGSRAVGIYAVASRIAEAWYFIPTALVAGLYPKLVAAGDVGSPAFDAGARRLFRLVVLLGYGFAIVIVAASGPAVELVFGSAYLESVPVLSWLAVSGVFVALGVARESWMLSHGLFRISLATTACGALTKVVANMVLIPPFGPLGAAVSTFVSQFVAVTLSPLLFRASRPVVRMEMAALVWPLAQAKRMLFRTSS